ncbi:hypothetical protein [Nocardia sp. CC227C]|nr:hypothetical protein [Nocardia sp. CC227C]
MGATVDWLRSTTPGLLVLCGLAIEFHSSASISADAGSGNPHRVQ